MIIDFGGVQVNISVNIVIVNRDKMLLACCKKLRTANLQSVFSEVLSVVIVVELFSGPVFDCVVVFAKLFVSFLYIMSEVVATLDF